jgi:hypothetical protein
MLYTFIEEPMRHAFGAGQGTLSLAPGDDALGQWFNYIPQRFQWGVFLIGAAIGLWALLRAKRRWGYGRVASAAP